MPERFFSFFTFISDLQQQFCSDTVCKDESFPRDDTLAERNDTEVAKSSSMLGVLLLILSCRVSQGGLQPPSSTPFCVTHARQHRWRLWSHYSARWGRLTKGPGCTRFTPGYFGEGRAAPDDEALSDIYPFDTTHSVSLSPSLLLFASLHMQLLFATSFCIHLHLIISIFPSRSRAWHFAAKITFFLQELCTKGVTQQPVQTTAARSTGV